MLCVMNCAIMLCNYAAVQLCTLGPDQGGTLNYMKNMPAYPWVGATRRENPSADRSTESEKLKERKTKEKHNGAAHVFKKEQKNKTKKKNKRKKKQKIKRKKNHLSSRPKTPKADSSAYRRPALG